MFKTIDAFGMEIPSLSKILGNTAVNDYVRSTLEHVLQNINISDCKPIVDSLIDVGVHVNDCPDYELFGHHLLKTHGVLEKLPAKLYGRAALIYRQIDRYVSPYRLQPILDLGCGDGRVGWLFSRDTDNYVTLTDVYKHPFIAECPSPIFIENALLSVEENQLSFVLSQQGSPVLLPNASFDTVLLLTVLHHADDPLALLADAKRLVRPGGRIVAIESVYGVTDDTAYGKLTPDEQRLSNIFFDHFYNRIVHYNGDPTLKVNVPFNFRTAEGWKYHAEELGLVERIVTHLGIDQLLVPEYHTLHVWDVP